MVMKEIAAKDLFTNEEYKVTVHFNLTKTEIAELDMGESQIALDGAISGGLEEKLNAIRAGGKGGEILQAFKDILFLAYGEREEGGRQLIKSADISRAFAQTPAYDVFFLELIEDSAGAAVMINSMLPEGWNTNEVKKDDAKVSDKPDSARRPVAPPTREDATLTEQAQQEAKVIGRVRRDESIPPGVDPEAYQAFLDSQSKSGE